MPKKRRPKRADPLVPWRPGALILPELHQRHIGDALMGNHPYWYSSLIADLKHLDLILITLSRGGYTSEV